MKAKLIQIGNSKGIRLSKTIIDKYSFGENIDLEDTEAGLLLKKPTKQRVSSARLEEIVTQLSETVGHKCEIAVGSGLKEISGTYLVDGEDGDACLLDILDYDELENYPENELYSVCSNGYNTFFYVKAEDKFFTPSEEEQFQIMSDTEFFNWYIQHRKFYQFFMAPGEAAFYYLSYFKKWDKENSPSESTI